MARRSDLTPLGLAGWVGAVAVVSSALILWSPLAGFAFAAFGAGIAAWRQSRVLRKHRRRPAPSASTGSSTSVEPPPVSPQRRFDAPTVVPSASSRVPVLLGDMEPIDWKELRKSQEQETGIVLGSSLEFVRKALGCRTVGIFLPASENQVVLRAAASDRAGLEVGTRLGVGDGLLGTLLKPDSPGMVVERELPPAVADLRIYAGPEFPRVLAAIRTPILGKNCIAFADADSELPDGIVEDLAELARMADVLLVRTRDLRMEMKGREIWQKLGRFERTMGAVSRESAAHEELRHFLLQSMAAEAVFFLLPEPGTTSSSRPSERWFTRVAWTLGADCDQARELRIEVPGRGIASAALARGETFQRKLSPRELVPLLAPGEPLLPVEEGGEILGIPVPVGLEGRPALLLMYRRTEPFHPSEKEVLQTALSSFGQAITRLRAGIELEKLATRDGLTGLLNHRTFQASFRRELLKARRTNAKVALFLTDVDFFKKVNDAHGHPAGDAVLRSVASTVSAQLREDIDIVARYGGEEFVCVLVGTTEAGAMETAERIRKAVEDSGTDIGEPQPKKVTISLGVAIFPDDGGTAEELIERTDQALYRAKHGGRNRVERALGPNSRVDHG